MQQFAVMDDKVAYQPIQGFTSADLGYERGNAVSNVVTKLDDAPWHGNTPPCSIRSGTTPRSSKMSPKRCTTTSRACTPENSPARIYFLILYNLFSDSSTTSARMSFLTTAPATRKRGSGRASTTSARCGDGNHQQAGDHKRLHPGGQRGTREDLTALAVIKYYELRNKSVLVLAPKKLAENWTTYNANPNPNIFARDRFNYDVACSHRSFRTAR